MLSSRVQPEEVKQCGIVIFFCFLGVETTPSAASFEDVACPVRYGIEVKVWHTMNPERHTRDALGDDLVLLRVSDPCHTEVDRRQQHGCHGFDLVVFEQPYIFEHVGILGTAPEKS